MSGPQAAVSQPTGRLVVVTGATGPAGQAVCERLTASGVRVVAVGTARARLEPLAAAARHVCDLTDAAATLDLAARIREELGSPDGVIHLVGGWRGGHDEEGWRWLEARLVTSLRNVSVAFREDLGAATAGRFAIVSSTSVATPTWSNANYATAKAASEAWVGALASGWRKAGTAAAVAFVVKALGDQDGFTPPAVVADAVAALWDQPAPELNGARIALWPITLEP